MSARSRRYGVAIAVFVTVATYAWAKPPDEPPPPATTEAPPAEPVLTGEVTREQIEESMPDWVAEEVAAQPDAAAARALAAVPPGAEVTVYLGTWCGDSKRELPRLWRALDETGGAAPVAFRYVAVGRDKKEPAALTEGAGLLYVPTFVVERDGREVGRIVEESPHGVERDLLALLDGSARGVVSARDDLQPPQP
ncbi:MAG TPA: hypothetical protein VNJ70_11480 [Thermoanaerobaculia bacterium]|nr:hypothetical protein [Thermoanaerobaculia bacterium]